MNLRLRVSSRNRPTSQSTVRVPHRKTISPSLRLMENKSLTVGSSILRPLSIHLNPKKMCICRCSSTSRVTVISTKSQIAPVIRPCTSAILIIKGPWRTRSRSISRVSSVTPLDFCLIVLNLLTTRWSGLRGDGSVRPRATLALPFITRPAAFSLSLSGRAFCQLWIPLP